MKLNTLTERQRKILLIALKNITYTKEDLIVMAWNDTGENISDDIDYLMSQLRDGKGTD